MAKRRLMLGRNREPPFLAKVYLAVEAAVSGLFWGAVALAVTLSAVVYVVSVYVVEPALEASNDWLKEKSAEHEAFVALSAEEQAFFDELHQEVHKQKSDGLFTYVYGSGPHRRRDCLRYEGHERELRARLSVKAAYRGEQTIHALKGSHNVELSKGCEPAQLKETRDAEASKGKKVAENKK